MCLIVNKAATENLKLLKGNITVWKVFSLNRIEDRYGNVTNVKLDGRYRSYKWTPRIHKAPVKTNENVLVTPKNLQNGSAVHQGIHVCLSPEEANKVANESAYYTTVSFSVPIKDLVAVGTYSDVVHLDGSKVGLPEETHYNDRYCKQAVLSKLTVTTAKHKAVVNKVMKKWFNKK